MMQLVWYAATSPGEVNAASTADVAPNNGFDRAAAVSDGAPAAAACRSVELARFFRTAD